MGKSSYCTSEAWSGLPKPQNGAGAGVLISFKLENLANVPGAVEWRKQVAAD